METLDLRKRYKHLYQPSHRSIELIEVPSLQFAMVDGAIEIHEAPDTSKSFADALQTVYGVSYTLRFLVKQREVDPVQYPVMPLEGLWWVENGVFDIAVKDNWHYTLMVLQPDVIDPELFAEGREQIRRKRGNTNALERIRLEIFGEGLCVQTMHIGPYATEPATIEKMKAFMRENGLRDRVGLGGKHHEIYLGDPRRAAPEKLRTVVRHPVDKASVLADSQVHLP
jgi:hypothetical protein